MAAITGSWKAKYVGEQIQADQWGTGYNPIHAIRGGPGRGTTPDGSVSDGQVINSDIVSGEHLADDYGYCSEDQTSVLWGYGTETGTADRSDLGTSTVIDNASTRIPNSGTRYPAWGTYPAGVPGGTHVRSEDHGAETAYTVKAQQYENAAGGWENKLTSEVNDAGISDPSQYIMQTSMVQRDKVRAGSQAAEGRENEYDAPIASRIPGMIEKVYSDDPDRLYDMTPKAQDMIVRPWYMRTAGTGEATDMYANESFLNTPLNRRPPDNAFTGSLVGVDDPSNYGYVNEDVAWYF